MVKSRREFEERNSCEYERIVFNIGGQRHETFLGTLLTVPGTRLAWIAENNKTLMESSYYDPLRREYFFDRHPSCFSSILHYYRTGKLHCPTDVCGPLFEDEILFWGIDEQQMESCCWEPYTAHRDKTAKLKGFKGPHFEEDQPPSVCRIDDGSKWEKLQTTIWKFFDDPYSSRGARINAIAGNIILCIFILVPVLNSMDFILKNLTNKNQYILLALEVACNAYFLIEILIRIICCPDKVAFLKEYMTWIDFLSLLPFVIGQFITGTSSKRYINVFIVFRIVKIFRTFRYNYALQVLVNTLRESFPELMLLVFLLAIQAMAFATCNYFIEKEEVGTMFKSIPHSLWWAFITMTTVGYGDMYPTSWVGQLVGIMCAICGLLMVALPVSVVATNFSIYYSYAKAQLKLPPKKKLKPAIYSNALRLLSQTAVENGGKDKCKRNMRRRHARVSVTLSVKDEHLINGSHEDVTKEEVTRNGVLPPITTNEAETDNIESPTTTRWHTAFEKLKTEGKVKRRPKKLDLATVVMVFGNKGTWQLPSHQSL